MRPSSQPFLSDKMKRGFAIVVAPITRGVCLFAASAEAAVEVTCFALFTAKKVSQKVSPAPETTQGRVGGLAVSHFP